MRETLMTIVVGLCMIGSLVAGIFAAKTGKRQKDQVFHCKWCDTRLRYRKYSKMVCPACQRVTEPTKSEWNRLWFEEKGNRFMIAFLFVLVVVMPLVIYLLFG